MTRDKLKGRNLKLEGNPNPEIRIKTMSKLQILTLAFGFRISFGLRPSGFGFKT